MATGPPLTYPIKYGSGASTFREKYPGSPEEQVAADNFRGVRQFYTPWLFRKQGCDDLLGYPQVLTYPGTTAQYIRRALPYPHPTWPNFSYAESVTRIEGITPVNAPAYDNQGVPIYEEALLTVQFAPRKYFITDETAILDPETGVPDESTLKRYCTFKMSGVEKFATLPQYQALQFYTGNAFGAGTAVPVSLTAAVPLYEADLIVWWEEVPLAAFDWNTVFNMVNKTNLEPFGDPNSPVGQFPSETVVVKMPEPELIFLKNGALGYRVAWKFKVYPQGANFFYWPNPPASSGLAPDFYEAWYKFGAQLYTPADFSVLFTP